MTADARLPDDLPSPEPNVGAILLIAAGILVFLAASFAGLFAFYHSQVTERTLAPPSKFPEPRLLSDESDELARLTAAQQGRLEGYGWVDRDAQIVSIPIERAMQIIAQRGAAGYAPLTPAEEGSSAGAESAASPTQPGSRP